MGKNMGDALEPQRPRKGHILQRNSEGRGLPPSHPLTDPHSLLSLPSQTVHCCREPRTR